MSGYIENVIENFDCFCLRNGQLQDSMKVSPFDLL